ncbi:carboxypeptidase B-like [Liolophura sinensis]|uniref:carboxypeptidase B-like n=1 Tax=Liolophura sinensis TaxID=3198878 RepID=UPI0031580AFA
MSPGAGIISAILIIAASQASQQRYDGHEVWTATPHTPAQLEYLVYLQTHAHLYQLDFWQEAYTVGTTAMFRVPPSRRSETLNQLGLRGMRPTVTIPNIQQAIDINYWMQDMAARFPKRASLFNISTSYEGRKIVAMKITGSRSGAAKPGFFLTGGMHAREWISSATVVYMAGQLIEQYGVNPDITAVVDAMDWYVLPVLNADGYIYSWTSDRLWRKTRSRHSGSEKCVGVDANRNWDWKWCQRGASHNPCSDTYCGPGVLSEPEVRGVANFIQAVPGRFQAYVDVHAFSQLWLTPWSYSIKQPSNYNQQDECSLAAVKALTAVYGTQYRRGSAASTLYAVTGGSMDWAHGVSKIPYAATLELRDSGKHGFLLPANQIIPSGEETLQGVLAMAKCVVKI